MAHREKARSLAVVLALVICSPCVLRAQSLFVAPDTATAPDGSVHYLPWQVARVPASPSPAFQLELTLPGRPRIDGVHKLDTPGGWLFSVLLPSDLDGLLDVQPEDIVLWNAGSVSLFFDGSCVSPVVPPNSNVDAFALSPDGQTLLVVFDIATDTDGTTALPSGIEGYDRTGAGSCDWASATGIDLAALSATYDPPTASVTALAAPSDSELLVSFDIPVDLAPSSDATTFLPGQIARLDLNTTTWSLFEDLHVRGTPGWPVSSMVHALSTQARPGRIAPGESIRLDRAGATIEIICPGSCTSGAEAFGIYEGTLDNVRVGQYDHVAVDCAAECAGTNPITSGPGDRYYLLVAHNLATEGSYGTAGINDPVERPQATAPGERCAVTQALATCPP